MEILLEYQTLSLNGLDNIINFSRHFYDDCDYEYYDGYRVQTEESIKMVKKIMGQIKGK